MAFLVHRSVTASEAARGQSQGDPRHLLRASVRRQHRCFQVLCGALPHHGESLTLPEKVSFLSVTFTCGNPTHVMLGIPKAKGKADVALRAVGDSGLGGRGSRGQGSRNAGPAGKFPEHTSDLTRLQRTWKKPRDSQRNCCNMEGSLRRSGWRARRGSSGRGHSKFPWGLSVLGVCSLPAGLLPRAVLCRKERGARQCRGSPRQDIPASALLVKCLELSP